MRRILTNFLLALGLVCGLNYAAHPEARSFRQLVLSSGGSPYLSPTDLALSPDGRKLYIACATANEIAVYDVEQREITRQIELPAPPSGLALSKDGQDLYVTAALPKSRVCRVTTGSGKIRATWNAGHTAMAPVLSPDGLRLYVCNRFNNSVEVIDTQTGRELGRVGVDREPVAAALTPDGKLLFVANHIHSGRADMGVVTATVSVIDTAQLKLIKNIPLTNGSTLLRGVCVSPDGRYVGVTHVLARYHLPATTVEHGWMNDNALSLIDVAQLKLLSTVLLDQDGRGAANPWAIRWSADGKMICITHAGTHELSVIDAPAMLAKLSQLCPPQITSEQPEVRPQPGHALSDVPNDLAFLDGLRTRFKLRGNGPRCLALGAHKIFVGNYFSDSLSIVEPQCSTRSTATIQLQSPTELAAVRKGEMYFNDGTLCYQGWQSCASCHSSDARVDGMNWDLLNDGLGNPKNVKSLLLCFQTPPVMSMGVRADASTAIRAGIRSILFAPVKEQIASAIDEYIKNLQPVPSPFLIHNRLSAQAERGQKLFKSPALGCVQCHPPPYYTDLRSHGIAVGKFDQAADRFYTPPLVELWRTGPYLHDGSAATLRDALLMHDIGSGNKPAAHLKSEQLDELVAYLQSL